MANVTFEPDASWNDDDGWYGIVTIRVDNEDIGYVTSPAHDELDLVSADTGFDITALREAGALRDDAPEEGEEDVINDVMWLKEYLRTDLSDSFQDALDEADAKLWGLYYSARAKEIVAGEFNEIDTDDEDAIVVVHHPHNFANKFDAYVCADEEERWRVLANLGEGRVRDITMAELLEDVEDLLSNEQAQLRFEVVAAKDFLREHDVTPEVILNAENFLHEHDVATEVLLDADKRRVAKAIKECLASAERKGGTQAKDNGLER